MAIHLLNDAAVVRNGDLLTILIAPNRKVTNELRGLLARLNSGGVEGTSLELRQLLYDVEGAMNQAFRDRSAFDTGGSDGR